MAIKLGMNAKAYYGVAGSAATNLINNIRDVTLNLETGEADVTTRGNAGWEAVVATLKKGSIEFEMVYDTEDAAFTAIQEAWFNATPLAFYFRDAEGGTGLDADFTVTTFSKKEPLLEAQTVTVTIKPTYSTRAPSWH